MAVLRPAQRPETAGGVIITKPIVSASRLRLVETSQARKPKPVQAARPSVLAFQRLSAAAAARHCQLRQEESSDGTTLEDTIKFTDLIKVAYEKNQSIFDLEQPRLRRMVLQRALWRRLQSELHNTPPERHGKLSLARVSSDGIMQPF